MAWLRAMGSNAPSELKIYDNGTWNVPYDNPGSWVAGFQINPAIMNATNFTVSGTASPSKGAVVGTANDLDLSNYTMLKIKAQISGGSFGAGVCGSKNISNTLAYSVLPTNSGQTEYVIDITSVTNGYVGIWCGDGSNRTATVTEITLA